MKKIMAMIVMLLALCSHAFAADGDVYKIAPDYQEVLGGSNASVELTDSRVMAAVANLKIYSNFISVLLPKGVKNYTVVRAGKEQAFLIIPHFANTRVNVMKAATRQKESSLKGDMEGRTLVLFCNKGDIMVDMLVRNPNGIQLVNFILEAEGLKENGRPGPVIIPERKQRFLKDVTEHITRDGEMISVD